MPPIRPFATGLALCLVLSLSLAARGEEPASPSVPADAAAESAKPAAEPAAPRIGWPAPRGDSRPDGGWPSTPPSSGWLWRYFLSLAVVGGLMVGVFVLLRRMRGMVGGRQYAGDLRILSRLPLDKHNGLFLLRTSEEVLTVASGAQGVRVLARRPLGPEDAADDPPVASPRPTFRQLLCARGRGEGTE